MITAHASHAREADQERSSAERVTALEPILGSVVDVRGLADSSYRPSPVLPVREPAKNLASPAESVKVQGTLSQRFPNSARSAMGRAASPLLVENVTGEGRSL